MGTQFPKGNYVVANMLSGMKGALAMLYTIGMLVMVCWVFRFLVRAIHSENPKIRVAASAAAAVLVMFAVILVYCLVSGKIVLLFG